MPFGELANIVNQLADELPKLYTDAVKSRESKIVAANRAQLALSKRFDGSDIEPEYSERNKKKKGISNPNLNDTGGFYDSIFVTETNKDAELYITSDEVRDGFTLAAHLQERYGENILGITDAELEKIKDEAINDVKNEIDKRIKY